MLDKEKRTIGIGAAVITILLVFFVVIEPIQQKVTDLEAKYIRQEKLLRFMEAKVPLLMSAPKTKDKGLQDDILSLVNNSLGGPIKQYSPSITQSQANSVQVEISQVPFEVLASWLGGLLRKYQFKIDSFGLRRISDGVVYATISLES